VYPKIIKTTIFISEDVNKKELSGLIIKRIISTIDTKEQRHTFLVTSVEESILYIIYTFYNFVKKKYILYKLFCYTFLKVYI